MQSLGFEDFPEKKQFSWRHQMMSQLFELPKHRKNSFSDKVQWSYVLSRSKTRFQIYSLSKNLHYSFIP